LNENDSGWAQKYLEQEQTKLILSLLNNDEMNKMKNDNKINLEEDNILLDKNQDVYKLLRPTLETLGIDSPSQKPMCDSTIDINVAKPPITTTAMTSSDVIVQLDFPEWKPSIDLTKEELDITGIDEDEIDDMILTREETKLKLKSWLRENKDWFLEEKRRERNKELLEQKKTSTSAQNQRKKRKKKTALNEQQQKSLLADHHHHLGSIAGYSSMTPAGMAALAYSALEAEKLSLDKRVSSKINYEVLKKLTTTTTTTKNDNVDDDGQTATKIVDQSLCT